MYSKISIFASVISLSVQPVLKQNHSHKKRKNSLETRSIHTKYYILCWNLANNPKHRRWSLKNLACAKGDELLEGDFHTILDKIEPDMLQITKK